MELFGAASLSPHFPKLKSIRGLGMSDKEGYAAILAEKFDYTNTFYDREPRLDFTEPHPDSDGNVRLHPFRRRAGTHRAARGAGS